MKTKSDTILASALLCARLQIREPEIVWTARARNGRYYPDGRLVVGPKAWRGVESCFLHELAHHLEHKRHGGRSERRRSHGPAFVTALVDITVAWYGCATRYDWSTEYKSIINVAVKRGYFDRNAFLENAAREGLFVDLYV